VSGSDPVRNGLVARLDRPGGNRTGVAILASDLTAKRFGIFHDLVPQAALITVLIDSTSPNRQFVAQEVEAAAQSKGVPIRIIEVGTEGEIETAFANFARDGAGGVFATSGFFLFSHAHQLAEQGLRYRLPLTGEQRNSVEAGALMFYGPSLKDTWRQVGVYAGRVLKGEKPGDLPVQVPSW
jgi:putative ABC transport system substrate-binding protein